MITKYTKLTSLLTTSLVFITSCNNVSGISNEIKKDYLNNKNLSQILENNNISTKISGKVEFSKKFTTKATLSDISQFGTVSLIYPHDHITNANKTIATGLTDSSGNFTINPSENFVPENNTIYVLEVRKRIGDAGTNLISLRTFIKHNGTTWESITKPSININSKTTALCIISDKQNILPSKMIGLVDNTSGSPIIGDISSFYYNNYKMFIKGQPSTNGTLFFLSSDGVGNVVSIAPSFRQVHNAIFYNSGKKIIFTATEGTTGNLSFPKLYSVDSDGTTNITNLFSTNTNSSSYLLSAISQDEKKAFYTIGNSLRSRNIDETGVEQIINPNFRITGNVTSQNFSKDFSKIVVEGNGGTDGTSTTFIYVHKIDGTSTTKISTSTTLNRLPSFSPNETKVVFIGNDGITNHVYIANTDGTGTPTKLSTTTTSNTSPSFSPDGSKVLFLGNDGITNHVYIANTDGTGAPTKLSTNSIGNSAPKFSLDGNKIVYQASLSGVLGPIYITKSDGSMIPINIATGRNTGADANFSLDGNKIVFQNTSATISITNVDGTGTPTMINSGASSPLSQSFSQLIKINITQDSINSLENLVSSVFTSNYDPLGFISFNLATDSYFSNHP